MTAAWVARRERARERGRFGVQHHSQPEARLDAGSVTPVTVPVSYVHRNRRQGMFRKPVDVIVNTDIDVTFATTTGHAAPVSYLSPQLHWAGEWVVTNTEYRVHQGRVLKPLNRGGAHVVATPQNLSSLVAHYNRDTPSFDSDSAARESLQTHLQRTADDHVIIDGHVWERSGPPAYIVDIDDLTIRIGEAEPNGDGVFAADSFEEAYWWAVRAGADPDDMHATPRIGVFGSAEPRTWQS